MMKRTIIYFFFALSCVFSYGQVSISGANVISDGTNYVTLQAAFNALTSVPNQTGKDIRIAISQNITETSSASIAMSATTPWNSLKIYPTVAGLTISAGFTTSILINFSPASYVTIDGSVGGNGTDKSLTIAQTGESAMSTIGFQNDSKYNTIKNCILKGGKATSGRAIIALVNSTTTGNDFNTITNNDFTGVSATQRPIAAIFATGASGKELDNLVISNNNFYDLLMQTNFTNALYSTAIYINGYVINSSITGNSFYESIPFISVPNYGNTYIPIYINNATGSGISVTNNYIGGSAPQCGGSPMSILSTTDANAFSNSFIGINIAVGTGTTSSIQNNTIKNIAFKSTTTGGTFTGINILSTCTGNVNVGTITGNKIGSYSETSITYTGQKTTGGLNTTYGITNAGTGNVAITGNTIGGIDNASSVSGAIGDNIGIYCNGVNASGSNSVDRNFITGLTASGSLSTIWAIRMAKGTTNYLNNIINIAVDTSTSIYGMFMDGVTGTTNNVYFNTVFISGTAASGSSVSYAMNCNSTYGSRDIRNNIFYNTRSGGANKHYTIKLIGTTGLTDCNYNDYFINGTTFLGSFGGTDKTTLDDWKVASTKDANSIVVDPLFKNPGLNPANGFSTKTTLQGQTITGITTDFAGVNRTTPQIGAWETLDVSTKIENHISDNLQVRVVDKKIQVFANKGELIEVYNSIGSSIAQTKSIGNITEIAVNSRGIFIVKSGNKSTKVIL